MTCALCNRKDVKPATINGVVFYLCYSHDIPEVYNHLKITIFKI